MVSFLLSFLSIQVIDLLMFLRFVGNIIDNLSIPQIQR